MKLLLQLCIFSLIFVVFACQNDVNNASNDSNAENTENSASAESSSSSDSNTSANGHTAATNSDEKPEPAALVAPPIPLKPEQKEGEIALQEYTCMGNEPNWNIQIKPSGITWFLMGAPKITFPYKRPTDKGDAVVFQSASEMNNITITIRKEACQDSMADVVHPFTSEVKVDGTTFRGCAR